MRVSLISVTFLFVLYISLASASEWNSLLQFCAKKALAVASQPKCRWMGEECYEKNEKYAANVSKFMCTTTFTLRKLSEFCCNDSLEDLKEIVRAATGSRRRRRSKIHHKRSSSSEFDEWIASYIQ